MNTVLSERECEVLRYLGEGYTKAEIASKLVLSENTIKTHVLRVSKKLGARNVTHAVMLAYRVGLLGEQSEQPVRPVRPAPLAEPAPKRKPRKPRPAPAPKPDEDGAKPSKRGSKPTKYDAEEIASKWPSVKWGVDEWMTVFRSNEDVYFDILTGIAKASSKQPFVLSAA